MKIIMAKFSQKVFCSAKNLPICMRLKILPPCASPLLRFRRELRYDVRARYTRNVSFRTSPS